MPPKLDRCVTTVMNSDRMKEKYPDEKTRQSHAFAICNASIKNDEGHMLYTTTLSEQDGSGWVHILPITEVEHPRHGTIKITPEKVANIVQNFDTKTRGIDLDIDYAHKEDPSKGQKAAGWIKQLQSRENGLWALPDWTPRARQEIADKEWRYMSSELSLDKDMLFGAALTNRPFMKNLAPINLSELFLQDGEEGPLDQPDGQYDPSDVNLVLASDSMRRCLNCAFFQPGTQQEDVDGDGDGGNCLVVSGIIDPDQICDFFESIRIPQMFQEADMGDPTSLHLSTMMKKPIAGFLQHMNDTHKADLPVGTTKDKMNTAHKAAHGGSAKYVEELRQDDDILVYKLGENVAVYRFRDVPKSERDKADSSDFAGKGQSFPILKPEDVSAALHSIGRAGSDNYDADTLRANIIRIAKRKGFPLPESAKTSEGGDMETKKLAEILKLDEGATEEQIEAAVTKLVEPKDEKTRKFAEEFPEEYAHMLELQRKDRERDADVFLSELHKAGMPAKNDAKIKAFMLGEKTVNLSEDGKETEIAVSFADILKSVVETGKVDLKDRGGSKDNQGDLGADTFEAAVKKFQEEHKDEKIEYLEAVNAVALKEPDLYKQYLYGAPTVGSKGGE